MRIIKAPTVKKAFDQYCSIYITAELYKSFYDIDEALAFVKQELADFATDGYKT